MATSYGYFVKEGASLMIWILDSEGLATPSWAMEQAYMQL